MALRRGCWNPSDASVAGSEADPIYSDDCSCDDLGENEGRLDELLASLKGIAPEGHGSITWMDW